MLRPDLYFPKRLCAHLDSSTYNYSSCFEDAKSQTSLNQKNTSTCFGSCQYCLMDWEVTAKWELEDPGCRVTTTIYYQLGDCRSPVDQKWDSFVFRDRGSTGGSTGPNARVARFHARARARDRARGRARDRAHYLPRRRVIAVSEPNPITSSREYLNKDGIIGAVKARWEQGAEKGEEKGTVMSG